MDKKLENNFEDFEDQEDFSDFENLPMSSGERRKPVQYKGESLQPTAPNPDYGNEDENENLENYVQWDISDNGCFYGVGKTAISLMSRCYRLDNSKLGTLFIPFKFNTDELIEFPDSNSDKVIEQIDSFWGLKEKFKKFGFLHKRGILLFGPQGSGKTCTVAQIVKKMIENDGVVINADCNPRILQDGISIFRKIEPNRKLLVIMEDLDALIEEYGDSSYLSLLDGEDQVDNVVFLATTNYPENLDARIINRPSRFDCVVKIGWPKEEVRRFFFEKKLPEDVQDRSKIIDYMVENSEKFGFAHMKEMIVSAFCLDIPIERTVNRLKNMNKVKQHSNFEKKSSGYKESEDDGDYNL